MLVAIIKTLLLIKLNSTVSLASIILDENIDLVGEHYSNNNHPRSTQHGGKHTHVNLKKMVSLEIIHIMTNIPLEHDIYYRIHIHLYSLKDKIIKKINIVENKLT